MKNLILCASSIGLLLLGCGQTNSEGPAPVASTSASSAPGKPSVQRKTTPAALRAADEQACLSGKADACRRMADRYRGYGHAAGCGIERPDREMAHGRTVKAIPVRLKRMLDDKDADKKDFLTWVAKACDLSDSEACTIEGYARSSRTYENYRVLEDGALFSNIQSSALAGFVESVNLIKHKKFLEMRQSCWTGSSSNCGELSTFLMLPGKDETAPKFTPEWLTTLQTIGEKTLDFDTLFMMLDKLGHSPEALAPLRAHANKTLLQACVEGSCVCGEAAKSLPMDDARVLDLARWGCENGEATGCYVLAKLHEEGRGVEKDETLARSLYEMACPSRRASGSHHWGEFEPAACMRLAEMAEGGANPPKDRARAEFYVQSVCLNPGVERDHSYCLKRAKYWMSGIFTTSCTDPNSEWCLTSLKEAAQYVNGRKGGPSEGKECERPSVKALCETALAELESLKKPAGKKK